MAFLLGSPKILALPVGEPVQHLEFDRSHQYLAVLTHSSLSLWSGGRDRVLLASYQHDPCPDSAYGSHGFKTVIWKPTSSELAVLTRSGALLFFSIVRLGPPLAHQSAAAQPTRITCADDARISLQFRHEERLPSRFLSCGTACAVSGAIACGTSEGEILRFTW
mmetsp:Transcript_7479/g.22781  ORF Transcript_7479/g.22781 Transcript_7479/m.22781 type:complete len:164 (-) Transcript_7479:75-566(-)|eukprot:CAMPEP_0113665248 /NCGR_PEP_ID=MMETSP0038_2-20120614/2199_1 /TAXON_ID=2898 /ORGANISM="Cryptomonas paramecium" /LENGTH=163 /DNA_ID=CAMNT_0000580579 /DNA_START=132 /DNA_END=623 /DNA_ORIENTATION=+ /assembly_acc=CAM_ASM_000170